MSDSQNPRIRERKTSLEDLKKLSDGGHLYAVVDACNLPFIAKKVLELGDGRAISLYRGGPEESYWDIAPYLVNLDRVVFDWLRLHASHAGWGVFLASKADLSTLRQHLRHFLRVQEPQGTVWTFRFYDPRVLVPFLSVCSEPELSTFFGPVSAYGIAKAGIEEAVFLHPAHSFPGDPGSTKYSFLFRLRNQHVEALKPQAEAAFAAEVISFLRATSPIAVGSIEPSMLQTRVLRGLLRARTYGFKRASSLAAFVAIMFDIAPNFDEHPRIHAVLTDPTLSPDLRIDVLMSRTTAAHWEEALVRGGSDAWERTFS